MQSSIRKIKNILGPGVITGAADDDPSGIATYSQTGAQYGLGMLWLSLFSFPLMSTVQEMCARIGMVTGKGLAHNIKTHYSKTVLYFTVSLLFLANTFNISADLRAMADSVRLLFPHSNLLLIVFIFSVFSTITQILIPYKKYVNFLKFLVLFLLCYVVTACIVHVDWSLALYSLFVPHMSFNKENILLICAIIGTTISPYLFFWQASQEIEEEIVAGKTSLKALKVTTASDIFKMRIDVWSGMFISNAIMFFIIVVCASVLFKNGITNIQTSADAAQALRPLAGNMAYYLFAFGIIGTGLLAIPTLAGSTAYALAETFNKKEGLYKKYHQAKFFYRIIAFSMFIAFLMNLIHIDPIKALIYSAVGNALVSPIMLFLIVRISSNKKIMGEWGNGTVTRCVGWFIVATMTLVAVVTVWFLFA
jgi:NRAMP (natural resistance-associated macrophage protein)-like metal ion transporter